MMRLITFLAEGVEQVGFLVDSTVYPLDGAWRNGATPKTMRQLLNNEAWRQQCSEALDRLVSDPTSKSFDLADIDLRAPVPDPSKLMATGGSTWSHLKETTPLFGGEAPPVPLFNFLAPSAIIGPNDPIIRPEGVTQIDYEIELAIVIGRLAKGVARDDALDYVAGFTVGNDVSSRDLQFPAGVKSPFSNHAYCKCCDTFKPLGPAIVTLDELPDLAKLHLTCRVNGDVRQDADASDYVFSPGDLIAALSRVLTLNPGDTILMGSPAGVGFFRDPPEYLRDGDVVESVITPVGTMTNKVVG